METSKELINTIEKIANVATWRSSLRLSGHEYNFTIIVCSKCKESVEHKLSTVNKYKYAGSSKIVYEFHTKREDISSTSRELNLDISSREDIKKINNILRDRSPFNIFHITDRNMYGEKWFDKFRSKKIYLHADYGMNLSVNIKRENDELYVSVLSNESFPGDVMPLAGQGLSHPIDKDINRIIFKNIVTPLKCSCEFVQNYKISEEAYNLC